jgi:hypothetical protein
LLGALGCALYGIYKKPALEKSSGAVQTFSIVRMTKLGYEIHEVKAISVVSRLYRWVRIAGLVYCSQAV